jgi:predicted membrane channel-forming protein YqfA (hemolysin III family)
MDASAPAVLVALEQSALGAFIRQSSVLYPLANVGHIVGLVLYTAAVAVLDLRLLGAFAATRPADIVPQARRGAMAAFAVMALSGLVLFTAEASHLALNPVFQLKAALIAAALLNAVVMGTIAEREAEVMSAHVPFHGHVRLAAAASLLMWLTVAACGRLIAYV